jgi:hypothetical protein
MAGVITDTPDEHPLRQNRPFPDAKGVFQTCVDRFDALVLALRR